MKLTIKKIIGILLICATPVVLFFATIYIYSLLHSSTYNALRLFIQPVYSVGLFTIIWSIIGYFFFSEKKRLGTISALFVGYATLLLFIPFVFFLSSFIQAFAPSLTNATHELQLILYSIVFISSLILAFLITRYILPKISKYKILYSKNITITIFIVALLLVGLSISTYYFSNEGSHFVTTCNNLNGHKLTLASIQSLKGAKYTLRKNGYTWKDMTTITIDDINELLADQKTPLEDKSPQPNELFVFKDQKIGWYCHLEVNSKDMTIKSFAYESD